MTSGNPLVGLATLLNAAFTVEEFRGWVVAHLDSALLHELPDSSTPSHFFLAVATLLQRHAMIDAKFFSALVRARKNRKTEIDVVRARLDPDWARTVKPTRSVRTQKSKVASDLSPSREAADAPSKQQVLTTKLGLALKAFSKAGNHAEAEGEWGPVTIWWKEWGPSLQVVLASDEYEQVFATLRAPKRRVKIYGKKIYNFGETVEGRVAEVLSTLKGLVNKHKPVKPRLLRSIG